MVYRKALNYLNSFVNYERLNFYPGQSSFKLERVKRLLAFLGNPDQTLQAIHIAGTKGKGSTCVFAANILSESGFKVGLYTSPHLVDLRERIRILQSREEAVISQKDFVALIDKIRPYAEKLRKTKLGNLSYFEILTACALLYFKEQRCNFVVLETGIGGRLDATNVVSSLVCAITPISYEHTHVLGTSLKKIASEKAAIIKSITHTVVTAPQRPTVLRVIAKRAKCYGVDLYRIGKDIQFKQRTASLKGQSFDVQGILARYPRLKIGLLGKHQLVNAAVAIGCVESLLPYGVNVSQEAIRRGLRKTSWLGRLQLISQRPRVVLDAAHNPASCLALKNALDKFFKFRNLILILGVSQDKDVRGILKELLPQASRVILTQAQNPRALRPEFIKTMIKTNSKLISLAKNSTQALDMARQSAKQQDLILVCGSLFLVGEVLKKKKVFNADVRR